MKNLRHKFEYVINDSKFFIMDYEDKSDQQLIKDNVTETERVAKELEKIAIQDKIDLLKKLILTAKMHGQETWMAQHELEQLENQLNEK